MRVAGTVVLHRLHGWRARSLVSLRLLRLRLVRVRLAWHGRERLVRVLLVVTEGLDGPLLADSPLGHVDPVVV